jgi:hypothetical protein
MEVFTPNLNVTGSITEAHVSCSKSYETNPEAGNNQPNKSRDDDKQRESFNTLFSTADVELHNQNIERLPTGCKSRRSFGRWH